MVIRPRPPHSSGKGPSFTPLSNFTYAMQPCRNQRCAPFSLNGNENDFFRNDTRDSSVIWGVNIKLIKYKR